MNTPRTRVQRRPVHGVLLLDKPLGLSSNQALQKAKWLLRAEKAGHTGTLDPRATGVLPLCFGAATKFSQLHLDADKTYEAVLRMGQRTSTGDAEGEVIAEAPANFTEAQLQQVQAQFSGVLQQVPPMHSALKKDGKALYEYAREGVEVERAPRQVTIHALTLKELAPVDGVRSVWLQAHCSKGTYIRTLGEDIGIALGCGAFLSALRRVQSGRFAIDACVSLEDLEAMPEAQRHAQLKAVDVLLDSHQPITLQADDAGRFLSGLRRRGAWPDQDQVAVYGASPHALLGTAHVRAGELIPERLLNPQEIQSLLESAA
ncbi:MAG: tRNA pseudouridine synthase [Pseudomonadota bacterium]|jgi:tRNA pseudouridine55 synthase